MKTATSALLHHSLWLVPLLCLAPPAWAQVEQPGLVPNRVVDAARATYFVSLNGSDANSGRTRQQAFATLQKAADVVQPGETVLVLKGEYRQTMHIKKEGRPDAWISFVAEPGVVLRGSDVRKDWVREPGAEPIYSIARPELFGNYQQPDVNLQQRTEQVFVDGVLLRQAPERAMLKPRGVFYVDDVAKKLLVCLEGGRNPNEATSEVTTRTFAIAIGGPPNQNVLRDEATLEANKAAYVRIDGFTIRHVANFSRMAAIQVRGRCHHITIENCDVQWANYAGLAVDGHHNVIRHCISSNNGAQGIGGVSSDMLMEYNILDNNNYKGISPWSEGGAIKTGFGGTRIVLRHNVARNNDNHGLWFDYGAPESIIENNFVLNAMAGGILNEVTPRPPQGKGPDDHIELNSEQVRQLHRDGLKGTIIRNNVVVGTRPPGGSGITVSNSVMTELYNNIVYGNSGAGISFGGSANRAGTLGLFGNTARSNIFDSNFTHATAFADSDDPKGRFFSNQFRSNLFGQTKSTSPFRISGREAGAPEWKTFNGGAENVFTDKPLFKNPERFDFTLADPALARQIGFDPTAMRLDWSAFYIPPQAKSQRRESRSYVPIEMSRFFNRALVDEVANDGKGGWTDQGGNDMSGLPTGSQVLDGVPYQLGTKQKGALLLDSPHVKPGGFPKSVPIPVGRAFDEINFLYATAHASETQTVNGVKVRIAVPEIARFVIRYADNTTVDAPVILGRHIYDWWSDPTWQQYAAINDNGAYVGWQGPNREAGKVTAYYLKWANPHPEKPIASVTVTTASAQSKAAFFLLGMTGAVQKTGGPRVFHLGFDGDVDALGSGEDTIEAQGLNRIAFDAGKFEAGVKGRGYTPSKAMHYPVPTDFPLQGQGTISLWLKADDWKAPQRMARNKQLGYERTMAPITAGGSEWSINFEVDKDNLQDLALNVSTGGAHERLDATPLVKPGEWFNVLISWQPSAGKPETTQRSVYFNGKQLSTKEFTRKIGSISGDIYIGVPANGGQPWRGSMDELSIFNHAMTPQQVAAHVQRFGLVK